MCTVLEMTRWTVQCCLNSSLSKMCVHCTFLCHLSFPWSRGSVDVPRALEVDVFLHSDEVGRKLPHILSVIDYADHRVTTREKIPVMRIMQKTPVRLRSFLTDVQTFTDEHFGDIIHVSLAVVTLQWQIVRLAMNKNKRHVNFLHHPSNFFYLQGDVKDNLSKWHWERIIDLLSLCSSAVTDDIEGWLHKRRKVKKKKRHNVKVDRCRVTTD